MMSSSFYRIQKISDKRYRTCSCEVITEPAAIDIADIQHITTELR